jgi:hypothetical protein
MVCVHPPGTQALHGEDFVVGAKRPVLIIIIIIIVIDNYLYLAAPALLFIIFCL